MGGMLFKSAILVLGVEGVLLKRCGGSWKGSFDDVLRTELALLSAAVFVGLDLTTIIPALCWVHGKAIIIIQIVAITCV